MFYLYVDLCVLADVDIVASAINASTAIRLLYSLVWPRLKCETRDQRVLTFTVNSEKKTQYINETKTSFQFLGKFKLGL